MEEGVKEKGGGTGRRAHRKGKRIAKGRKWMRKRDATCPCGKEEEREWEINRDREKTGMKRRSCNTQMMQRGYLTRRKNSNNGSLYPLSDCR